MNQAETRKGTPGRTGSDWRFSDFGEPEVAKFNYNINITVIMMVTITIIFYRFRYYYFFVVINSNSHYRYHDYHSLLLLPPYYYSPVTKLLKKSSLHTENAHPGQKAR